VFAVLCYAVFVEVFVPPVKTAVKPGGVAVAPETIEGLISLGEGLYNGRGACALCHESAGRRAPSLSAIIQTAEERIKNTAYKGNAKNAEEYIIESMVNPSAYVTPGFGVKGSKDSISPMPDVTKGAIGLNQTELKAVTMYLLKRGGLPLPREAK
ncbi:MAG: hypothetical protein WA162_05420, partial [Thermodesulfobacteriota bacterium]